jgi:hypothetical protein
MCEHGIPMRCLEHHAQDDPRIGQALCPAWVKSQDVV